MSARSSKNKFIADLAEEPGGGWKFIEYCRLRGYIRGDMTSLRFALVAAMLLGSASGSLQAGCLYQRAEEELSQCRPVELLDSAAAPEEVLARIVCRCRYANPDPACGAPRRETLSFVLPTRDIRETCGQGPALCDTACPAQRPS